MRKRAITIGLLVPALIVGLWYAAKFLPFGDETRRSVEHTIVPYTDELGFRQVSSVHGDSLAVFNGETWDRFFWTGVNLGASTPGYSPGDLSPTREDYLRWFEQMREMNTNVIRIYTILPPYFYEALADFNRGQKTPLMVLHGIWSPEEELIGEDELGRDAYLEHITSTFENEIRNAVGAVHGKITIEPDLGHAYGTYTEDISQYVLGWIIGTEWYPYAVQATNDANPGLPAFEGTYFRGTSDASPFENWLARMMNAVAEEDMKYGWQRPIAFTNWLTTDPLRHPNEPLEQEDLVSVDPMHAEPTEAWKAGYFAAYHVYPYYPDFLRFEPKYLSYVDRRGNINPYAGYLHDLRSHHEGIPLFVAEFGLPSSRGIAHFAPLGHNQGMHNEDEQGRMVVELLDSIHDEGLNGALLFEWHDEWFKFTWNTVAYEEERQRWRNRLTNEEHFGVLAVEPSDWSGELITIDGSRKDWDARGGYETLITDGYSVHIAHDESDLHLLLEKASGEWDISRESIRIGFDTIAGGPRTTDFAPGVVFPSGVETMLRIEDGNARMVIGSAYDQLTWTYGVRNSLLDPDPAYANESLGIMLPWLLPTDLGLYLPETKVEIPFDTVDVGQMIYGVSDPNSPDFNSLADWYESGNLIEIRIPWMLMGFTDPSSKKVWDYPYRAGQFRSVPTDGIAVMPIRLTSDASTSAAPSLRYRWDDWIVPHYHERKKKSFYSLQEAFGRLGARLP